MRGAAIVFALAASASAASCSSSSQVDANAGSGDASAPRDSGNSDKTTGLTCATDGDCDKSGAKVSHCSNGLYLSGPVNPTAVCVQVASGDVCAPSDDKTIRFCDDSLGLCVKRGATQPATCEPLCMMAADGTFAQKCAGKNACNVEAFASTSSGAVQMIGTCQGGCASDGDCPAGSKCDPLQKICARACSTDGDCAKGWKSVPAGWKCDATRGACGYAFAKKLGDDCTSAADCLCFRASSAASGYCTSLCRSGDACGAGFTCDALLPRKDAAGADVFTLTKQPVELAGYCLKNCAADADCPATQACDASAGLTQKTCRPKATASDGGA